MEDTIAFSESGDAIASPRLSTTLIASSSIPNIISNTDINMHENINYDAPNQYIQKISSNDIHNQYDKMILKKKNKYDMKYNLYKYKFQLYCERLHNLQNKLAVWCMHDWYESRNWDGHRTNHQVLCKKCNISYNTYYDNRNQLELYNKKFIEYQKNVKM